MDLSALISVCAMLAFASGVMAVARGASSGDPKVGEAIYSRCAACHALAYDRTGPRHCGVLGRRAGTVPGFDYSDAMKRSKIVWNERTLDRFLANPLAAVPGTSMGYAGIADRKERADLIAYLEHAGESSQCRK
jgi:cytochrome c